MQTANRELMREWNRKLVLKQIRKHKATSHVNLVKQTSLSAGTITSIIRDLRKDDFIRDIGRGESKSGRKPDNFAFNPDAKYIISVALFALETKIAVVDLSGNIKHKTSYPTRFEQGPARVFENLAKQVSNILLQHALPRKKISAVCVSIEGIVDNHRGLLKYSSHFGWKNVLVKDVLQKMLGSATFVEAEGRTMALGEYWFGAGKNVNDMLCVDIDSGIGAALIKDGDIYHGSNHMEGEIGHSFIVSDGPECLCGRKGCLETISSGSAIIKKAVDQAGAVRGENGSISKISGMPEREAIRTIFSKAGEKDKIILKILGEAGYYLGLSIANIVAYSDPELVVLTGYLSEEDPGIFFNIIEKVYKEKVFAPGIRKTKIVKSALSEDSVLIGGATLAYKQMFEQP